MICPLCKGKMVKGKTTLPYEFADQKVLVIRDVPAMVCEQCGDAFVEMKVARQAEKIATAAKNEGLTLGLISFPEAA